MTGACRGYFAWGLLFCSLSACSKDKGWPLKSVEKVDVSRYSGTWYEVATYPSFFQRGCSNTQAIYTPVPDRDLTVKVRNTCTMAGRQTAIEGEAFVPDAKTPGQLKVRLKVPIVGTTEGDYYIVFLDEDYGWAVVGHPNREYLWILSRKPALSMKVLESLLPRIEKEADYKNVAQRLRCTRQDKGDVDGCEATLAAYRKITAKES